MAEKPPHLPAAYELLHLTVADSARDEAIRQARSGAGEGTLVWVDAQHAGRARLDRPWLSPPQGLYCALVLRPEFSLVRAAELPLLACVALGTAMAEQVQAMTDLRFRWPNDVILNQAKLAGVWLDAGPLVDGLPQWLVLSCAVNVGEPPPLPFAEAACVAVEGGVPALRPADLLAGYARQLLGWLERWDRQGLAPVLRQFIGRAQRRAEPLQLVLASGEEISGSLLDYDPHGGLVIQTAGALRRVSLAEFLGLPA